MKNFLMMMWQKKRLTEAQLRTYCPIFLTEQEVSEILNSATPLHKIK